MTDKNEKAAPGVVGRACIRCGCAIENDTSSICNACIDELEYADRDGNGVLLTGADE